VVLPAAGRAGLAVLAMDAHIWQHGGGRAIVHRPPLVVTVLGARPPGNRPRPQNGARLESGHAAAARRGWLAAAC
jgi:hypothetical protein